MRRGAEKLLYNPNLICEENPKAEAEPAGRQGYSMMGSSQSLGEHYKWTAHRSRDQDHPNHHADTENYHVNARQRG